MAMVQAQQSHETYSYKVTTVLKTLQMVYLLMQMIHLTVKNTSGMARRSEPLGIVRGLREMVI